MDFDIIEYTDEQLAELSVIQLKLLRVAQKTKNELDEKYEEDLREYKILLAGNNMLYSTLYDDKQKELKATLDHEVDILREQLVFNMSLNEPLTDDDLGESDKGEIDESTGYVVDYSLSYLDRYILVRDYYMSIEDSSERMALYKADTTAKNYLGSYYTSLYEYLSQYV